MKSRKGLSDVINRSNYHGYPPTRTKLSGFLFVVLVPDQVMISPETVEDVRQVKYVAMPINSGQ